MTKSLAQMLLLGGCLMFLGNCTALSAVESAAKSLDVYELRPVPAASSRRASGSRKVLVETPSASGTLATDRIVVKPSELEVKYLPGARWTEEAPAHFQRLLAASLTNSGRFGLVSVSDAGLTLDYLVLTDLNAFQAAVSATDANTFVVTVKATLTVIREEDRELLGTRVFESQATAASDIPSDLVPAFDIAMQSVLRDASDWVVARTR